MPLYTIYAPDTGRIVVSGFAPTTEEIDARKTDPSQVVLLDEALRDDRFYLPGGMKTGRPFLLDPSYSLAADGAAELSLPVPAGTRVRLGDDEGLTDGAPIVFVTAIPGVHRFEIEPPFPARPQQVKVTAS